MNYLYKTAKHKLMIIGGKALIKKAFKLEKTERVPWVPFVGCHGAKLVGCNATEYLQSTDNMVKGINQAIEHYKPDGIPVMFDLQLEAEALGCSLVWSDENPPAVVSHILTEGKTITDLKVPSVNDGRIPLAMEVTKKIREQHPDIALYGLITGPFTLALHLMGTDIFMKMMEAPEEVMEVMAFCNKVAIAMSDYYIQAGCDVVAVVDPMTSQIDPMSFEMYVTPPVSELFSFIRGKGALSSFFVCGHAEQNIEAMCGCKPDNISIDENIALDFVKEIALKNGISFGGNMKLTVVMLMGTEEDCQRDALECMELGGDTGFVLAPGCDLPMATPPENVVAVTRLVHDPYEIEVLKAKEISTTELELLDMKDYGHSDKVIIDVITLDSESCAPCQYMVEAVKRVSPQFEGLVEWREHAIKKMEAVTFMSSLMVKNIPTICIDGKIAFVSQIPPQQELIAAIQKRINEKMKRLIAMRKTELHVFADTEDVCNEIKANINKACMETGKEVLINSTTDPEKMQAYGIIQTPSVVLTEHKTKSQGEIPKTEIIREWLKDI